MIRYNWKTFVAWILFVNLAMWFLLYGQYS
jgi:hypothetical protein